jgi:hypothetical protein
MAGHASSMTFSLDRTEVDDGRGVDIAIKRDD